MPDTDVDNYDQLKLALLKRYQLTEEGFRKRFRESKSEKGETVYQFVARLSRYFRRRWVELSGINKTYDGLEDFMVREQYLSTCGQDLAIFLRERIPKNTKEMTRLAEQYIEARGVEYGVDSNSTTAAAAVPARTPSYGEKQCYICHRTTTFLEIVSTENSIQGTAVTQEANIVRVIECSIQTVKRSK